MRLFRGLIALFITATAFTGCNIINPAEQIPTYIKVDSFTLKANPVLAPQPYLSSQITSVWAYYNGINIGAFDLPAQIPVIANGRGTLTLEPAVALNGLNNFVAIYPFYQNDTFSFDAKPGQVISHEGTTKFYNNIVRNYGFTFKQDTIASVPVNYDYANATYIINLPSANDSCVWYSISSYYWEQNVDAYLEFDYIGTNSFYIGVQSNLNGTGVYKLLYLAGINPSTTWKKFYLGLKDYRAQYKADNYNFFIKSSLDPGSNSGQVKIKNLQFIHF